MADATCERVRASLSARADGEPDVVDDAHLASCDGCRRFEAGVRSLRGALRFEVLDGAPDVAPAVLARIEPVRRRSFVPVAAALLVGALIGAAFVWPTDRDVAVASLPARIVAAQGDVASVAADLEVVDGSGTRRGSLRYRAPEAIALSVGAATFAASDVVGVEPFADDGAVLDIVLPASAFTLGAEPPYLGERTIDGRDALGVRVTAAQVDALLGALRAVAVGRDVHPTDDVELWLDREHLVPLAVVVRVAAGPDRARWSAARGIAAGAGDVVVEVRFESVRVNDASAVDGLAPPEAGAGSFVEGDVDAPAPAWLPAGMRPWRAGTVGDVAVQTWTDGRAWLKVRSTTTWRGGHLFGGLDRAVRRVELGAGVAYVGDGGATVALHAAGTDLVVLGSIAPADLRRVAASLDVVGERVPATWDEAAVVGRAELVLPRATGFVAPAVRVDGETTTMTFAGAGERVVVLATRPGTSLRPPTDPDAVGVLARGTTARWSPASGDLEWVEAGRAWSLRSRTVGLGEMVALADALVEP